MKNSLIAFVVILFSTLTILMGCGASSSGGNVSVNLASLSAAVATRTATFFDVTTLIAPGLRAVGDYGAAAVGASGLESYKLYVSGIQLCESITTSGTAYSNPTNCTTVYENSSDNYDTFGLTEAAAAGASKYVDLVSATERATLKPSVAISSGTYNVGIISWYRPIKVKGQVALTSGGTLRTKACPPSTTSSPCTITDDMGAGAVEEAVIDFNNGGTWFRFLKPFTVTAGEAVSVDLAFDLEKKLFAGAGVSNGFLQKNSGCTGVTGGHCGIYMPILRFSPVPRRSSETTQVEIYEMTTAASAEWKLRAEVFYNSADTTKTVLAADLYAIPTSTTASNIAAGVYVYQVDETAGVTNFKTYDGNPSFSFTRGTAGTGTLTCPAGATLPGCTGTTTMTWTTREVKTLSN